MSMLSGRVKGNCEAAGDSDGSHLCDLWSLIGLAACCVLSDRRDVGGAGAPQFISTYKSICQDLNGCVLRG